MSISGIGAAGYPAAGYETRRTERNVAGGDFAKQAAQATATLHGADEGSGDITVFSGAEVVSGSSYSVYKTQDFDPENPVYKVKVWDKSGNATERMVDVSKVDPKNCDTVEMYAYTANLVATLLYRPIITLVACHRINRYNDMRTEKGKGFRTLIFCREACPETFIKAMVIISKYEVEYKKDEDIFNQQ